MQKTFTSNVKRTLRFIAFTILSLVIANHAKGQTNVPIPAVVGPANDQLPLGTYFGFQSSLMQYTDAEMTTAGLNNGTNYYISQVSFYLSSAATPAPSTPVKLYMKTSTGAAGLVSSTYSSILSTGYVLVYDGVLASGSWTGNSWITIT